MPKSRRGFAAMSPEQQRAIASAGGRAAHQSGHAHEFTSEEAREAGRKGGAARHRSRVARQPAQSQDTETTRERTPDQVAESESRSGTTQSRSPMDTQDLPRGSNREISDEVWEPVADPRGMSNPESEERSGLQRGDGELDEAVHATRPSDDSQTR